jgi:phosphocarrier protein HPr|tara:strand:+ start:226 stop:495 length:270 start_codon:yes stop_codon:yes gene_type:complete
MTQSRVAITNELGLHLRAAARLVVVANRYRATVTLSANGKTVDGKSLLGITSLLARMGTVVTIEADGEGEAEAIDALVELIQGGFKTTS